jgi:CrcB protein
MRELPWVMLAGAFGTAARYLLAGLVQTGSGLGFPVGTLTVNVVGCFAVGWLGELALLGDVLPERTRVPVFAGFLGAFTTYSAFGHEVIRLFEEGYRAQSLAYVVLTTLACVAAVWAGIFAARFTTA